MSNFNGSLENGWLSADACRSTSRSWLATWMLPRCPLSTDRCPDSEFGNSRLLLRRPRRKVRSFITARRHRRGLDLAGLSRGRSSSVTSIEPLILFTRINNGISPVITNIDNLRNSLPSRWSDLGGRTMTSPQNGYQLCRSPSLFQSRWHVHIFPAHE